MTVASVVARRARLSGSWRPPALLASGLWTLAMLGIVLTPQMPLGVTVMGLLQAAIGAGLLTRPSPFPPTSRPPAPPPRSRCPEVIPAPD